MPGAGIGGLISNLVNPGLDDQIAAQITPNPNPLAQQGQPAPATSGSPNMPNAAATKQDPVSANLAALLLKRQHQAEFAADFNQNIQGVAAGFGTAQQQQAKQAALGGRGGGAGGGGIGDVSDIMGIQRLVTDQNEHARFMANASVFAQTLRDHGINVTDQQATELMNNPKFMDSVSGAFGSNVTQTGTVKDADAATAAWAAANPNATEQQKADYRSNLIAGGMGGNDLEQRQYLAERQTALTAGQKDFPDFATWKADHATQAKVKQDLSMDRENATQALPDVNRQLNDVESKVDEILKDPNLDSLMGKWTPNSGPASLLTATEGQRQLAQKISNLMSTDYAQGFKIGGASRKTQFELGQLSAALNGSLGSFNLSPADYRNGLVELKNKFRGAHANAYGETGDVSSIPSSLQGYLDPSYRQGGNLAGKGAPGALTKPSDDDKKDFATIASKYGRQAAILHFREIGIDPSGL